MDGDAIRNVIYSLVALFAFVTTIWAMILPTIREHPDGAYWLTRAAWAILVVIGLVFVASAQTLNLTTASDDDAALYFTLEWWVGLGIGLAYLLAGCGVVWTLSDLSRPRK